MSPVKKSVLISGTSTGIGAHCAQFLSNQGFQVFAGVRTSKDQDAWHNSGASVIPVLLDVTDAASIQGVLAQIHSAVGENGLAGLVNNAGIAVGGPIECLSIADWRHQFEVNVFGALALTKASIPLLRQGKGRIVNVGSVAGLMALPFVAPYSASKYALEAITDALRIELKPWGIHVAIVEPGSIDTPIWQKSGNWVQTKAEQWEESQQRLYASAMEAVGRASERSGKRGLPPVVVSRAILHALQSKQPKTRYPLGPEAILRHWMNGLPDLVRDWLIIRKIGLPC